MKKITFFAAIAMIAFTTNSFAQDDASAFVATNAKVITPITIAGVNALSFGDIVGTAGGGTVTIATDGGRSSSSTDLLITGTPGTVSAASFTVTGEADYTYEITLPTATFLVENGDTEPATMSVGTLTASPGVGSTGVLTGGSETVSVGAILTVAANQATGVYTNANEMIVTVYYN
jgi:hypothetical protein